MTPRMMPLPPSTMVSGTSKRRPTFFRLAMDQNPGLLWTS
jgi:hypothetical protein